MCHQTHVQTSRDPLAFSSNLHLATTECEIESLDRYLQKLGKMEKPLPYVCYKYNPFLPKSDPGTSNLISEIMTCHQVLFD